MDVYTKYKKAISAYTNKHQENIFLFWKGRVALYAILKAMGIKTGDEIIISGFSCVVVPNAVIYLGAKPVYVDINKDTYNTDLGKVINAVTERTRAIIIQNTFGLSSEVDKIAEFARARSIFTVEDCTHGFAGTFKNMPNGSYCDAAFYSTQWNKPYSTGIGGFAVINNDSLCPETKRVSENLLSPSLKDEISLLALNFAYYLLIHPGTQCTLQNLYRYFSEKGFVIGSSSATEISSVKIPDDFFKGVGFIQSWLGIKRISKLSSKLNNRKDYGLSYTKFLLYNGKNHVKEQYFSDHSFLKYPLLVKDREVFQRKALQSHIPLGDWFISPLHPVTKNFEIWFLDKEKIPVSTDISKNIVNLPTDGIKIKKVISFLESELDLIL